MQSKKNSYISTLRSLSLGLGFSLVLHGLVLSIIFIFFHGNPTGLGRGVVMVDLGLGGGGGGKQGSLKSEKTPEQNSKKTSSTPKKITEPVPQNSSTPGEGGLGIGGGSGGGEGVSDGPGKGKGGGGDGGLNEYIAGVLAKIESKKYYPKLSRENGEEGEILVELKIGRSGQLLGSILLSESPSQLLAQASLLSVKAASPFPPLPVLYERDSLTLEVPVRFKLR